MAVEKLSFNPKRVDERAAKELYEIFGRYSDHILAAGCQDKPLSNIAVWAAVKRGMKVALMGHNGTAFILE